MTKITNLEIKQLRANIVNINPFNDCLYLFLELIYLIFIKVYYYFIYVHLNLS